MKMPFSLDCSSDNISPSGYVSSPEYPNTYPRNVTCRLYIEVPENYSVKIEIVDFALHSSDFLCVRCFITLA